MRALAICGGIALAIVVTVALAPVSGWIFKNQLDLTHRDTQAEDSSVMDYAADVSPDWVSDPATYTGSAFPEQIAHAVLLRDSKKTEPELEFVANAHPTEPLAWSTLVREICMANGAMPDSKHYKLTRETRSRFMVGRKACLMGESLEPNNAYFSLLRASFDATLGLLPEMKQALKESASKTDYNSHINDLEAALRDAPVLEKGYRGELIENAVINEISLPDLVHFSNLGRYINHVGDLQDKRNLVQASWTMTADADLGIEMLVATKMMRYSVGPPRPRLDGPMRTLTDSEWTQQCRDFEAKLAGAQIASPQPNTLEIYLKQRKAADVFKEYMDSNWMAPLETSFWETVRPFAALLALACSILMAALAWGFQKIKSDLIRRMLPHLSALPLYFLFEALAGSEDSLLLHAGFLLGLLQLSISLLYFRKRWAVLGCAVAALVASSFIIACLPNIVLAENDLSVIAIETVIGLVAIVAAAWLITTEKRQQVAPYVGGVVALLSILISFVPSHGSAVLGGFGFGVTLLLTRKTKSEIAAKIAHWSTVILFVLAACAVGGFAAWEKVTNPGYGGVYFAAGLLALFVSMLFIGKTTRNVIVASCASWILFSGFYLITVGVQVRGNHEMANAGIRKEGATIRKLAGI